MSTQTVGAMIAKLRKEKSETQEELAVKVGVSPQAVSKWENGGMPDAELLPRIADCLEVSIDRLFGRDFEETRDAAQMITTQFAGKDEAQRVQTLFALCWEMEKALFDPDNSTQGTSLKERLQSVDADDQLYSSIMFDSGFTRMGVGNRLPYFLVVPEARDKKAAFFDGVDYLSFFKDLSDVNVFKTIVFLHQRENKSAFTVDLLVKKLNMSEAVAADVIQILQKYRLLHNTSLETEGWVQEIYTFAPTPSFAALLIFARELIDCPQTFTYHMSCRTQPYL